MSSEKLLKPSRDASIKVHHRFAIKNRSGEQPNIMASRLVEKVFLYFREGAKHDKVYNIELTEDDSGFRVTGYNGRRGARLTPQSKTSQPVSFRTARHIFDELLYAKLNHRKTPYQVAKRETGEAARTTNSTAQSEPHTKGKSEFEASGDDGTYVASHLDALEF